MIEFGLKEPFPELQYILPIFNRLVVQKKEVAVAIKTIRKEDCLQIRTSRCEKHSFVKVNVKIPDNVAGIYEELKKLKDVTILQFFTDSVGSKIGIQVYESYDEIPAESELNCPTVKIPVLDAGDSGELTRVTFKLHIPYKEISYLVNVFNILLQKNLQVYMRMWDQHLEILFQDNYNVILKVGFGPSRLSEKEALTKFNLLLARSQEFVYKFYYDADSNILSFRASELN